MSEIRELQECINKSRYAVEEGMLEIKKAEGSKDQM